MLFVVDFPTTPFNSSLQGCFPNSFEAEVGIFFSILLFQWYIFYYFFRRHCDVALFTHHLDSWGSCSFLAYPFNRSVVISFEFSNLIKFSFFFQSECCPNYINLIPSLSSFNRSGFNIYLITKPTRFSNVSCSSFLTDCLQSCSSLIAQPLKVCGFTHWSKKQLGFTYPLPLLFPPVPS